MCFRVSLLLVPFVGRMVSSALPSVLFFITVCTQAFALCFLAEDQASHYASMPARVCLNLEGAATEDLQRVGAGGGNPKETMHPQNIRNCSRSAARALLVLMSYYPAGSQITDGFECYNTRPTPRDDNSKPQNQPRVMENQQIRGQGDRWRALRVSDDHPKQADGPHVSCNFASLFSNL